MRTNVINTCPHCSNPFPKGRSFGAHVTNCSHNPRRQEIVQKIASSLTKKKEHTLRCLLCKEEFKQKLTEESIRRGRQKTFCSVQCAAATTSRNTASKRSELLIAKHGNKNRHCICGRKISVGSTYCNGCYSQVKLEKYETITLKCVTDRQLLNSRHRYQPIRNSANKKVGFLDLPRVCGKQSCNYSLHLELAHIKPISSFKPESLIGEINSLDNLSLLCRNCHWEFDHGYVEKDEILTIRDLAALV